MDNKKPKWTVIFILLLSVLLVVNIAMMLKSFTLQEQKTHINVPVRFILEYPDCANKFLETVNITNVQITPPGTIDAHRHEKSILRRDSQP